MRPTRRDDLGEILPIDVRQRPRKVLKHFYNPRERWDALVGSDVAALVAEARAAGVDDAPGEDADPEPKARGTIVLQRHHDLHYGPAYLDALAAGTTRWASQPVVGPSRALACSAEGVLIAFDRGPRCKVVTAFRPDLPLRSVHPTEQDFAIEARRRWRYMVERSERALEAQDLADALDGDRGDLASAWRLAVAVGRARLATSGGAGEAVAQAEARLAALDRATRDALLASFDEGSLLDTLVDAVQEGDGAEVLDRLVALEDALAAAAALGDDALAERLAEEAAVRASCAGPELVGLAAHAEARASVTTAVLSRYWREVGAEIVANAIRLAPPARSRRALLSLPSAWLRESLEAARVALGELILGVSVAQPILSSRPHPQEVLAEGRAPSRAPLRAFVVDREHPAGTEVTELIVREGESWRLSGWQVAPGDEGTLVVISGAGDPVAAPTLADLLAAGDGTQEVDATPLTGAT